MTFTDKMRESLGGGGVRVEIRGRHGEAELEAETGGHARSTVQMVGGTRPAHVNALVIRLVEADRHWVDAQGARVDEDAARGLGDRSGLTAGWTRRTIGEQRVAIGRELEADETFELDIEFEIPSDTAPTTISRSHTLNVQADIPGQIDPTANARIVLHA